MVVPVSAPGFTPPDAGAIVVIGVGNEFRRDDGAGPAVIASLGDLAPPGVRLVITDGEPARLVEAWSGAAVAVVIDAVRAEPPAPGDGSSFRGRPDRGPERAGRPARTASAWMTRSRWPWRLTGCPRA